MRATTEIGQAALGRQRGHEGREGAGGEDDARRPERRPRRGGDAAESELDISSTSYVCSSTISDSKMEFIHMVRTSGYPNPFIIKRIRKSKTCIIAKRHHVIEKMQRLDITDTDIHMVLDEGQIIKEEIDINGSVWYEVQGRDVDGIVITVLVGVFGEDEVSARLVLRTCWK